MYTFDKQSTHLLFIDIMANGVVPNPGPGVSPHFVCLLFVLQYNLYCYIFADLCMNIYSI